MKIPEPLFLIINPMMRFLLRSPMHAPMSDSLMLITFKGRKTGREFTTPVRYVRVGDAVRAYTSREGQWWRNLKDGADVTLRIAGENLPYHAIAVWDDPPRIRAALEQYIALHPHDAAYHEVRIDRDKQPVTGDLERASRQAVFVEARPIQ